jgi:uncharacterized protein (DUF2267 family)
MRYEDFIARVAEGGTLTDGDAEQATRAVLTTLAERIGAKEASDTASQLPRELQPPLTSVPTQPEPLQFDAHEFVRRVAHRTGFDDDKARRAARAVFLTLHEAVAHGELEDWESYLSPDYIDIAARHADGGKSPRAAEPGMPGRDRVDARKFLRRVAERAGLDDDQAEKVTEAVLETLGERIAFGEAADLAQQLPEPAASALVRTGGDAQAIPVDEFVHRVAEREHAPEPVAREHVRAVLATVRESVTADEWRDTLAELPREYEELLA